jgi:glycerophosphoryl diester phosphodiesterase
VLVPSTTWTSNGRPTEEVFTRFVEEKSGDKVIRRWPVHDFTLAELKRLDAGSWMDEKFAGTRILTFQEAIDLVRGKAGLYPELKDPEFYRQRGVDPVKLFADVVKKNGLEADPRTPLVLQSFDEATLKAAAIALPAVPRVFVVSPADAGRIDTPQARRSRWRWHRAEQSILEKASRSWRAHAAKLTVTPDLPPNTGMPWCRMEMQHFLFTLGVDAPFTDNPTAPGPG